MALVDIRRTYSDGNILFAADLDAIIDDIETILNITKLNDDNIQNAGITASTKLVDGTVTTGKLATAAVTAPKIGTDAVITAKIMDENVTRPKLAEVERIPTGALMPFAGTTAPVGWLLCDGSDKSRTVYAALFAVLQETYGTPTDASTFKLPDMRGRTAIGAGTGPSLSARTLAGKMGAETHTLSEAEMPTHTHSQNPHRHSFNQGATADSSAGNAAPRIGAANNTNYTDGYTPIGNSFRPYIQDTTATNNQTGGSQAHNNMQPSLVLNYIIKY